MIQDWKLERYRLGELPPAERAEVEAALADPSVKARLDALETDSKAVLARLPAAKVAGEVERRARVVPAEPKRARWVLVPALAMAAALAIVIGVKVQGHPSDGDDILRPKGDSKLMLFKQTPRGQERLYDKSLVKPHDVVQVKFDIASARQMVVVSIDGAGHATLHFPLDGNPAPPQGALAQAFELDEAPGFERFFLITSDQALSTDEVMDAARALALRSDAKTAPLTIPKGSAQRSVRLDKVTP